MNLEEFLNEYKSLENQFRAFNDINVEIVKTLLKKYEMKAQAITQRIKEEPSLVEKFDKFKFKNVRDVDDIAGCRVTFYLDSEAEKFAKVLVDEFGWENTKKIRKYNETGYIGYHVVAWLDEKRLSLPEYSDFKGFKCEIQVTTVLYHAWNELNHDSFYKPPKGLKEFDEKKFETLQKGFESVVKEHLIPAMTRFEHMVGALNDLKEGKAFFVPQTFDLISESSDNNAIYDNLVLLKEHLREHGLKIPKDIDLGKILTKTIEQAEKNKVGSNRDSALGSLPGHSSEEVIKEILDVLSMLRFHFPDEAMKNALSYTNHDSKDIVKSADEVLKGLSEYDINALDKLGFGSQLFVLDELEKLELKDKKVYLRGILLVTKEMLEPNCEGRSYRGDTITISRGTVPGSKNLGKIRNRVLTILFDLLQSEADIEDRVKIIESILEGTTYPYHGDDAGEIRSIIESNTQTILDEFKRIFETLSEIEIAKILGHFNFIGKRLPDTLKPSLSTFLTKVENSEMYVTFSLFFSQAFEKFDDMNEIKRDEKERRDKILKISKKVKASDEKKWTLFILRYCENFELYRQRPNWLFLEFCRELAKKKYPFVCDLLESEASKLTDDVKVEFLTGLSITDAPYAERLYFQLLEDQVNYSALAKSFSSLKDFNNKQIRVLVENCIKNKETEPLNYLIASFLLKSENFSSANKGEVRKSLKFITSQSSSDWIHTIYFNFEKILPNLSKSDIDLMLQNLVCRERLNNEIERFLTEVSKKYPNSILDFFYRRIKRQKEIGRKVIGGYDAIPFDLYYFKRMSDQQKRSMLRGVLKWLGDKDKTIRYEGKNLIQAIFATSSPDVLKVILKLIKSSNKKDQKNAIDLLNRHDGISPNHPAIKAYISNKKRDRSLEAHLIALIMQTGVVKGKYGFYDAYQAKKEAIEGLIVSLSDKSLIRFHKKVIRELDIRMTSEKKRADFDTHISKIELEQYEEEGEDD